MSAEKKESTPATHAALAAYVNAWAKSLPSIKEARAAVAIAEEARIEAKRAEEKARRDQQEARDTLVLVENAAAVAKALKSETGCAALDFLVRDADFVAPTGGSEAAAQRRQWAMAPQSKASWRQGVYTVTGKGGDVRKAYSQLLKYVQEKTC